MPPAYTGAGAVFPDIGKLIGVCDNYELYIETEVDAALQEMIVGFDDTTMTHICGLEGNNDQLKAKGWPVAGVDLGDVYPDKPALSEQGQFKYVATMNALREMGYLGVGIGC